MKVTIKRVEVPAYRLLDDGVSISIHPNFIKEYSKTLMKLGRMNQVIDSEVEQQKNLPDNVIPIPRKS